VHSFFIGLNWNNVMQKKVAAPYIPPASDVADTSNFEDVFTKEKPLDSVVAPDPAQGAKMGFLGRIFGTKKQARKGGGGKDKRVESLSQFDDFGFVSDDLDGIGKKNNGEEEEEEEEEEGEGEGEGRE